MTKKLFWSALRKFTAGFVLVGGLLFLPAGTLAYPAAWRFLALLFFPMLCLGAWLMVKSPPCWPSGWSPGRVRGSRRWWSSSAG